MPREKEGKPRITALTDRCLWRVALGVGRFLCGASEAPMSSDDLLSLNALNVAGNAVEMCRPLLSAARFLLTGEEPIQKLHQGCGETVCLRQ